jgi:hypothetical protein
MGRRLAVWLITSSMILCTSGCTGGGTGGAARGAVVARDARADFRPTHWEPFSRAIDPAPRDVVLETLCGAPGAPDRCGPCVREADPAALAACALDLRYGGDPEALGLARALFDRTGVVAGVDPRPAVDGGYLGDVPSGPALPTGPYRKHLEWVVRAIDSYEDLFAKVTPLAHGAVLFRTRPLAFRFYRTARPSYPSAYAIGDMVGYNLEGVLHTSETDVGETLFHELFHLNDKGHGYWSLRALSPLFLGILQKCGGDHDCLTPFAPDATVVPGGTYYSFDGRTGEVREYAAEVGLRWYREQRAALGGEPMIPPFKCLTPENEKAWTLVADEFFGGVDVVPPCDRPEQASRDQAAGPT